MTWTLCQRVEGTIVLANDTICSKETRVKQEENGLKRLRTVHLCLVK